MNFRHSGRSPSELRPIKITPHFLSHPPGSCLIEMGGTRVVCSAMIEDSIPNWLKGQGKGWLTAEYSMLPASSGQRIQRERNKIGGRTMEIQRLIGRSLRAAIDMNTLGERSILVDCDVIDADGGTRTASITGSYVAVMLALQKMSVKIPVLSQVAKQAVAAVSVGMVKGTAVLDLDYPEDKDAEVDMNVVMTSEGKFIEVQGTAENEPFDRRSLDQLLQLAERGINELFQIQKQVLMK
ncbi:MAG: ribonuclease PH [Proteobacteria bacterium]|nr:ribonuclease PH [Pseudomonadota bacterium]